MLLLHILKIRVVFSLLRYGINQNRSTQCFLFGDFFFDVVLHQSCVLRPVVHGFSINQTHRRRVFFMLLSKDFLCLMIVKEREMS